MFNESIGAIRAVTVVTGRWVSVMCYFDFLLVFWAKRPLKLKCSDWLLTASLDNTPDWLAEESTRLHDIACLLGALMP